MKIRMLTSIAGHADPANGLDDDFSFKPGELLELDEPLAEAWIAAGHAEVAPEPKHRKVNDREAKAAEAARIKREEEEAAKIKAEEEAEATRLAAEQGE